MSGQRDWDDELGPAPTPQELEQARALRDALQAGSDHPEAQLARALRAAWSPAELDAAAHQAILERALQRHRPRRALVISLAGAGVALALAAGFMLAIGNGLWDQDQRAAGPSLIRSRSTQGLFGQPFARHGGESSRMDRIAQARSRDFRNNRFERLGVR